MTTAEKNICNIVLHEGTLANKSEYECDGIHCEFFEVEYMGERYEMTKHNNEWVYFIHTF